MNIRRFQNEDGSNASWEEKISEKLERLEKRIQNGLRLKVVKKRKVKKVSKEAENTLIKQLAFVINPKD